MFVVVSTLWVVVGVLIKFVLPIKGQKNVTPSE